MNNNNLLKTSHNKILFKTKRLKNILLILFVFCTVFSINVSIKAAQAPSLNKTNVSISTADILKLKVLNTKKNVIWTSSNNDVVKVNKHGKVTPIWFGKAVISAKVGRKTLKCTIKVLEEEVWSTDGSDYSVAIMQISEKKARIKIWAYDYNSGKIFSSGNLIGKYSTGGNIVFMNQGKYSICGGLTTVNQNGEEHYAIVVSEANNNAFITDGIVFDYKIENS